MTLIASDGLEYADLTQRLLGNPLDNGRNGNIRAYRQYRYREDAVKAYIDAFDKRCPEGDPGPSSDFGDAHSEGVEAAFATGGFGPPHRQTKG